MVGCQPNLFFSDENISIRGGELERFMPVCGRMSTLAQCQRGPSSSLGVVFSSLFVDITATQKRGNF